MKVFLSVKSLRPEYGGPAYSVSQLAAALARQGADVGLWSADQSAATSDLIEKDERISRLSGDEREALRAFGRPDVIHDNGMWLPHNHGLARAAAEQGLPRVVSTRGMLEPWAFRHKRWKKSLAWWGYQKRDLVEAQLHHATSEQEAGNLRKLALGVPLCTIPNGVDLGRPAPRRGEAKVRTALFIGRIYPVKGLPMLVEAWGRTRPKGWRLEIAGPDEAAHRAEVERAVGREGLGEVVSFLGPLTGAAKRAALSAAHLLVLPSHSESFGMAVAEGLAHALPVLATTAVPWPDLEIHECGWRVPPTVEGLSRGLSMAEACDAGALRAMGERGRALVASDYGWESVARKFFDAYVGAQAQG